MNNQGTMRIGEVHAILRRDVPDIELSKIRYYEDKGLVQPTRSRKGYRLYSERDVECLREAIRLAHEEFVPLRVVRLRLIEQGLLDDGPVATGTRQVARATSNVISVPVPAPEPVEDPLRENVTEDVDVVNASADALSEDAARSLEPGTQQHHAFTAPDSTQDVAAVAPVLDPTPSPTPVSSAVTRILDEGDDLDFDQDDEDQFYSRAEFLHKSGLDAALIDHLVTAGLLSPENAANQSTFSESDLRVARSLKVLLARNVDIRLLGSLRRNVEREIGLLNDLIQPVRPSRSASSAREAHDNAKALALDISALRAELFARALHQYLGH
jgi:DNA-binding transcriptional MerR regulator